MSSTDTKPGRSSTARDVEELSAQVDAIRSELQNLTSTIGKVANRQFDRAQGAAMEKAAQAEEAIKENPLTAVAIALGLGFLFGVFTRR